MPSRRTHSKSRNGCTKCKASKCDEARPSCARCLRREVSCQYLDVFHILQDSSTTSTVPSPQPPAHAATIPEGFWNDVFPPPVPSPGNEQVRIDNFGDRDLELLHHYSTSTYLTLATRLLLEEFWQVAMVRIALSNTFVMHGILALSACHLAYLRTEAGEYYGNLALHHYTAAISLFRPLLDNVDSQTAVPTVAFSTLVGCLSLAIPQAFLRHLASPPTGPEFVNNLLQNFRLTRGVKTVLGSASQWIKDSPMAPLLIIEMEDAEVPLEFHAEIAVRELEAKIRLNVPSEEKRQEYLAAIALLRQCFPRGPFRAQHQALISAWPVMVQDTFFTELLEMKVGFPLVIIGYYGVLMHFMSSNWWIGHKGKRLVEAVSCMLEPKWQDLMTWPMTVVHI